MGLGPLTPRGTSVAKIFLQNFNLHMWLWDQPILHLPFPPVSVWLLYILSYRTSIQLDFRGFAANAVL